MRYSYIIVGFAIIVSLGMIGVNVASDPMERRWESLRADLERIRPGEASFAAATSTSYQPQVTQIVSKPRLWEELIPPPPPPPKRVKPPPAPDLAKMLEGVLPTRQAMGRAENVRVLIKTKANPRGDWYAVGDSIQGVPIVLIDPKFVRFGLTQNDQQYNRDVPRQ